MKIAVVHDYLCGVAGSDRVFQYICEEFAEADVFTLAFNPATTLPYFSSRKINTTYLNPIVQSLEACRWSFPLATYAMESLDLESYDVVLTSSTTVAKYVKVKKDKHICYCYIPTRALWHFDDYFGRGIKSAMVRPFLKHLRNRDYRVAQRIGRFIAISKVSQGYIRQYYGREAEVLYCPIDLKMFHATSEKSDNFLIVSRLEHWKRVDYAIEAFNALGIPLRVIGTGTKETALRALAKKNITFLGEVDDETLAKEYSRARAVVFTPFLEYGLVPLEASASGTPVICFGKGGVTETMIGDDSHSLPRTAVFFFEQTPGALVAAVREFERLPFDASALVVHAKNWDVPQFKRRLRQLTANGFPAMDYRAASQ
jgi:glycosyltransferase involved in cell wall biosynthesis